jgi:predicted transcriptional regulator
MVGVSSPSMTRFTVRLPDGLASQFDEIAAGAGGRSDVLRQVIERVCAAQGMTLPPLPTAAEPPNRIEIRLPKEDADALEKLASQRRMKRTEWIVALIQSRLREAPVPVIAQLQELIDIRRELRAIGKNVNQAVKALHAANMEDSRLELGREAERVASFKGAIDDQIIAIGKALRGDLAYWQTSDE